jgi:7-cyano-7-deazaguanine synthase in queuosine biosynthesis
MKEIKLSHDVVVKIPDGPIGVMCSGGCDSSLMLYILMANTSSPIHIFTLSNNKKDRTNALIVPAVIEKCIQLTGNINVTHHSSYAAEQTVEALFKLPQIMLSTKFITGLFYAVTKNPPDTFPGGPGLDSRTFSGTKTEISDNGLMYQPFINKDKQTIATIYQELNLIENLFPLTRSCETTEIKNFLGHCGDCWWCEERKWGFGNV